MKAAAILGSITEFIIIVIITKMSLVTGESSSASPSMGSDRGPLAAGVRGLSGAITMERSEHEKLKYPDRINLDRKGLHGKLISHCTIIIAGLSICYPRSCSNIGR